MLTELEWVLHAYKHGMQAKGFYVDVEATYAGDHQIEVSIELTDDFYKWQEAGRAAHGIAFQLMLWPNVVTFPKVK